MIDGVRIETLEIHADERGRLVELFREAGGQVHLTTLYPGVVKGWHRHRRRTDQLVCVFGMVRLGLYDEREGSKTHAELNEFFLGIHSPLKITVPPGVWFGLKACGGDEALVAVHTDPPHDPADPDEERMDPLVNEIPFDWERRDR